MNRFVIADPSLCIGCHTCEAACSENHRQHGLQSQPRLKVMRNSKDSAPQLCHHCEDAPCAQVCPVNAITRVDGAIQLNESLCVSCKLCGIACPFGAIAVKCDLCHFDPDGPACVRTCPTKSLRLVNNQDIARASKRKRELTINTDLGDLSLFQSQQGER